MNQIGPKDSPEPRLLAKWLYDRIKKHPMMRRHIDKVRDAPATADERTFGWLWDRMELCIRESQQEQNALCIHEALKRGPTKAEKDDASGMPATSGKGPKGKSDGKGKGKQEQKGKGTKDNPKSTSDRPKGSAGSQSKTSELTPAQKAQMPCIYLRLHIIIPLNLLVTPVQVNG